MALQKLGENTENYILITNLQVMNMMYHLITSSNSSKHGEEYNIEELLKGE